MRILGLVKKDNGVDFHRIIMPLLMAEGVDTRITNNCQGEDDLIGYDAIYYSREISDNILNLRNKLGFKVILDVDDYWKLDPHHPAFSLYQKVNFGAIQINHIRQADLVTTTHERLAELIYPHNQNVVVTPNAIADHECFKIERTESEYTRLFWQGSITHEKDLELLRNPFKRLDRNRFLTVLSGYSKHETWDRMVHSFTNGLSIKGAVLPAKSPDEYYKHYALADIALVPLVKSTFNSMKSNLKVLEAAHSGIPVIASHVDPYLDLPLLYVKRQIDWLKHINNLAADKEQMREYGKQLQDYCQRKFNFNKINQYRLEQIKKVVNKSKAA